MIWLGIICDIIFLYIFLMSLTVVIVTALFILFLQFNLLVVIAVCALPMYCTLQCTLQCSGLYIIQFLTFCILYHCLNDRKKEEKEKSFKFLTVTNFL